MVCPFRIQPSTSLNKKAGGVAKGKRRCGKCDVTFATNAEYMRHYHKNHPSEHVCSTCGKKFTSPFNLSRHQNAVHHRLKPFVCSFCDKCFGTQGDVDRHEQTVHLKQKNFECIPCKKRFAQSSCLHQHNRSFHSENPPTFACYFCDKAFTRRSSQMFHERKKHGATTNNAT